MTTMRMWQIAASLVLGTTLLCAANDASAGTCTQVFYLDSDKDGYGTSTATKTACTAPAGYVAVGGDCNDKNAAIKPGAAELCDAVDNDCDAAIDEGVQTTYYRDADADTYGTPNTTKAACTRPSGYVTNKTDCNDANAAIKPGATEVCDAVDNDCDASIDEGVKRTYYRDGDADTYGLAGVTTLGCTAPVGYVTSSTDCNDTNASIHPNAAEVCNGVDEDCDGLVDEGKTVTFYRDVDGDTFGGPTYTTQACAAPSGYVTSKTDCNDGDRAINPAATELCDGKDNDCDTSIDEGVKKTFYADVDTDGYGNSSATALACTQPAGYVTLAGDCNDDLGYVHPGAAERCNSRDDDCDGKTDEDQVTYFADRDADTYGNENESSLYACNATIPSGLVIVAGDCNDLDATIHPLANDVADHIDNDCDGVIDGTTDVCRAIGTCSGRDVIACDLGNPNETGNDAYFADLVGACTDHSAVPLEIASESDDRCVASALSRWDSNHYFAIGLNRIAPQTWHWEGSGQSLAGGYTGETVEGCDNCWTPWDPEYAASGETVLTINYDGGWGGHAPFNWWSAAPDRRDLQRILCER